MSLTISCPNCHAVLPVDELQGQQKRIIWCHNCGYPLKVGPEISADPRSVKILWIDDDRLLLSFGKDALEQQGYRMLTAHDGPSGIETAKKESPDLIIVDVLMPNMDGYEVCRRLRAEAGLKDTPIFLLTALEDAKVDSIGREVGATFTMSKPSRPERVLSAIDWMLTWKLGPRKS